MNCSEAQVELTALADGALEASQAAAVRKHIDGCSACSAELTGISEVVQLSGAVLVELPVLRPGFETRLRARLGEERARPRHWYQRLWRPALVGAVAAAGVLIMARSVGGPSAVLVPLGIKAPPQLVAEKPTLFKDYQIIERLDELENFETVIQTPLEPEITGEQQGAG